MHQIGNTFTRLQPVIEFTEDSFEFDPNTVCVIGEPPKRFAAIHSQGLLNAWYQKLQACLNQPVQVEQRKGHRRVQVLGTAIFDFDAVGFLQVYVWDFDESDRVMLTQLPSQTVVAQGVPYGALWMERFKLGATRALQQRHPGQETLIRYYVAWAQARLASQSWKVQTQDHVRYQIAVALDLDIQALEVAARIQLSSQPKLPLRTDVYNHAIKYRTDYQTLSLEAPQLIPLYALLADEVTYFRRDAYPEVTAWMQRMLLTDLIKPAMWRLLCRVGTDWIKEVLAYFDFDQQDPVEAVLDILRIAQVFGTEQLVPAWLLHSFLQLRGNPNSPTNKFAARLHDLFPLCGRLGHFAVMANEAETELLKDRAQDIFNWASDHWKDVPKDYARRATLRGLIRKTGAQQILDAVRLQGYQGWKVPYELALKTPDVQAVILDSPLAIWTEGRDMRHCAANYIDACKRGECVMVSLRSPNRSRALATVAFDVRSGKVSQKKLSGFANTLVSPEVLQLAKECRRQLQSQRNRMPKAAKEPELHARSHEPSKNTGWSSFFKQVQRIQKYESNETQ